MREGVELPPSAAPAALATLLVIDAFVLPRLPIRPLSGVVDEAAHAATAVALLAALPRQDSEFVRGFAAGSILLDIDHVPELWGRRWLRPRGVRPLPHSVGLPALLLAHSVRKSNRAALGAAVGVGGHLLRDLATGKTSVPLLWPLTRRPFSVRYRKYVAVMAVLAAVGAARATAGSGAARPPRGSHPESPLPPAQPPPPDPGPDLGAPSR
jgi:membrane-bound metal-dependent hydrolase YbcI (DUF457 family)